MRFECLRGDAPTKFWQYKLKRMTNSNWALFVRYGLIDNAGDDMPLVRWSCVVRSSLKQCRQVIKDKTGDRLALGYKPA